MTTPIDARISRLLRVDRVAALEELRRLADDNPPEFLELLGLLLDEADGAAPKAIQFVITQQSGSDNRT